VNEAQLFAAVPPRRAVASLIDALRSGVDPTADFRRSILDVPAGDLVVMPTRTADCVGVKLVGAAPENAARGIPRIHGVYVHFDAVTLVPRVILDGAGLTTLRTPAVSVAAVLGALTRSSEPLEIAVFGTGPQATGHVVTIVDVLDGVRPVTSVTYISRTPRDDLPGPGATCAVAGTDDAAAAVRRAGAIVCATTSGVPVLDSALVRDDAVVMVVGSHDPGRREVETAIVGRAQVVVEDIATVQREGGDVVMAIADGALTADQLVTMRQVARGEVELAADRPVLFKGSGMGWEDAVVAEAAAVALGY
jgi:ornithine cyclodeaminase